MEQPARSFHSRFGGLWLDRSDAPARIADLRSSGSLSADEAETLARFSAEGFAILPQAADLSAIASFEAAIAEGFARGNPALRVQTHGSRQTHAMTGAADRLGSRVVDSFVALPQALDVFTSPKLLRFLNLIFDAQPLLFQSLSFDQGSQQGLHQDTAYVAVNRPMELAACWIALEDITPGSGELLYMPGSHRFDDYDFGFGEKHWRSDAPNADALHAAWSKHLLDEGARRGLTVQRFLPKRGDILIWHADLAHGGATVENAALTRRSLVGHFCPVTARPRYFDHGSKRDSIRKYRGLAYASEHYDLGGTDEAPALPLWQRAGGRLRHMVRRVAGE